MANYTKFTSIVYTRNSYDEAVALADEDARAQAIEAFGSPYFEASGQSELKVKFNDNGTYTATSILYATPVESPAQPVDTGDNRDVGGGDNSATTNEPAPVDIGDNRDVGGGDNSATATNEPAPVSVAYDDEGNLLPGYSLDENNNPVFVGGDFVEPATAALAEEARLAARENATKTQARDQQTAAARLKTPSNGDWRVRLSLAASSDYLYNDSANTLLAPLKATNGVIFPYTPIIDTNYKASYDTVDLTHSNYRGYFYKNSYVDAVNIRGTFTAQDTREASYLLAVIHFFRSVTKMFYGQDPAYRGSPPPLTYLSGMGQFQFNNHPCLVSTFAYNLPNDVDYIRVDPNNYGLNMLAQKTPALTGAGNLLSAIKARLSSAGGIPLGGIFQPPVQNTVNQTVNSTGNATYVPTKMEISLTLLPIQSRRQVSQQFSFKDFANGNQLKGGFW